MGIKERKLRQKEELRQSILAAAEEMFVSDGVENVSMRKIAEKIEYSPTTIYRLFKNKAEIMNHLIADGYLRVSEVYQEVLSGSGDTPLQMLNGIIRAYMAFALDHPKHFELWFATGRIEVIDDELHLRHGDLLYKSYATWLERIEECKAEGLFAEKGTLTVFQLIWSMVVGAIALRIKHPDFPWLPLDQHIDEILELLNRGLGVEQD
ncbi:MAG: TetR/AcrR family transcriptional regulator [bacterium]|nr:TetR/AcrR family transcriptional regulator [bacterium]